MNRVSSCRLRIDRRPSDAAPGTPWEDAYIFNDPDNVGSPVVQALVRWGWAGDQVIIHNGHNSHDVRYTLVDRDDEARHAPAV